MRVLVVEADRSLGTRIVELLNSAGFETIWWTEGQVLEPALASGLALAIFSLATCGLAILKSLRNLTDTPVIVLCDPNDTSQKIDALRLGADDAIAPPIAFDELLERVHARLRRPELAKERISVTGSLRLDRGTRDASLDGESIDLTRVEFELLAALANRPGVVVTRRWLAENVLDPEREGTERTIDVHVSRLRKKLGAGGRIETLWGVGYRLKAD